MSNDIEKIRNILSSFNHPETNCNLVELGMIGNIDDNDESVTVELKLPFPTVPIKNMLIEMINDHLKDEGIKSTVRISIMTDDEREKFMELSRKNWAL